MRVWFLRDGEPYPFLVGDGRSVQRPDDPEANTFPLAETTGSQEKGINQTVGMVEAVT